MERWEPASLAYSRSVAIAPSSESEYERFFRVAPALLRVCPVPLAGVASVEASGQL